MCAISFFFSLDNSAIMWLFVVTQLDGEHVLIYGMNMQQNQVFKHN